MTGEEMEKAMQFLLNQQAQLTADVSQLDAAMKEMRIQTEEDRRSMREMITIVVEQANADRAAIHAAIQEIHIINERFTRLESQRNNPQ